MPLVPGTRHVPPSVRTGISASSGGGSGSGSGSIRAATSSNRIPLAIDLVDELTVVARATGRRQVDR